MENGNGSLHRYHHPRQHPMEMRTTKADRISDTDTDSHLSYPSSYNRRRYVDHHHNERHVDRMPEEERFPEPPVAVAMNYQKDKEETPPAVGLLCWKALIVLAIVLSFAAMIIGIIAFENAGAIQNAVIPGIEDSLRNLESSSPLKLSYPTSCQTLDKGLDSGLYIIRPNPSMLSFPVYCDMSTDDGGWTLVASVHENNIDGKCTRGDKWSSEEGRNAGNDRGSLNWENLVSFGRVEDVTYDDYKNPAYYAVEAKDVMIWHVPNGNSLQDISSRAFLKYYTTSGFLENNGDTLRDMFKEYATVRPASDSGLVPLLRRFNETINSIFTEVPGWHSYRYDGINEIRDGDNDLYDTGNQVFFRVNRQNDRESFTRMVYNAPYVRRTEGVEIQSVTSYPFAAVAWVGDGSSGGRTTTFEYRVDSNFGADGDGRAEIYNLQEVVLRQMRAVYTAFVIHGAETDASICEVYFYIGSKELWNTTFPEDFQRIGWRTVSIRASNTVRFSGDMGNVLLGYALLSRENAQMVTRTQIANVLRRYMELAETFQYHQRVVTVTEQIRYAKGNNALVGASLPTSNRTVAEAGYIQFRAVNTESVPNALCPGVRVRSGDSQRVCIGGGNSAATDLNICGDYAGWAGSDGDRGNATTPSATGRSLEDINSSILIFTR